MKLLDNLKNKSTPSKETLISWIRWIKRYCIRHSCSIGDCKYCTEESGARCIVPSSIIVFNLERFPQVEPQEPPKNVLDILRRVNVPEIINS